MNILYGYISVESVIKPKDYKRLFFFFEAESYYVGLAILELPK
jgi:hypothetical protein